MKLIKQYTDDYVTELEALEKENECFTELEALENLNDIAYYEDDYGDLARQSYLTLKVAIKRNEPMKLKAKRIKVSIVELITGCINDNLDDYRMDDYCTTCDEELYTTSNYCPHCGQKLDWSDE